MEVGERGTINHNSPPQSNQESSPRLTSALNSSNNTRNENPDQSHLHRRNHYYEVEMQEEQMEAHRPRRESDPDPDPDPAEPVRRTALLPSSSPPHPSEIAPSIAAAVVVRYRECQKNHAACMGAHVVDGCGEFMANGEEGTPEALKCAACECHRSFHRREVEGESQSAIRRPAIHNPPLRATTRQHPSASTSHQQQHRYHHQLPPFMVAFGGTSGGPAESSSEDLNMFQTNVGGRVMGQPSKKRFRTKFTEEQKEKMHDFAERIGWKIQKQDEHDILQFCNEVGLKRQVFKVWMHNSKQAMKKKQLKYKLLFKVEDSGRNLSTLSLLCPCCDQPNFDHQTSHRQKLNLSQKFIALIKDSEH